MPLMNAWHIYHEQLFGGVTTFEATFQPPVDASAVSALTMTGGKGVQAVGIASVRTRGLGASPEESESFGLWHEWVPSLRRHRMSAVVFGIATGKDQYAQGRYDILFWGPGRHEPTEVSGSTGGLSVALYDDADGTLLHSHHALTFGDELPDEASLRARALELAHQSRDLKGRAVETLVVASRELRAPGVKRVDLKTRRLIVQAARQEPALD